MIKKILLLGVLFFLVGSAFGQDFVSSDDFNKTIAKDVVVFLKWAAEPELEVRKNLGIKVILFFIILGFIVFLAKNRLWKDVH